MYKINLLPLELRAWNKQVDRGRLVKVALLTTMAGCIVLAIFWACQQLISIKEGMAAAEQHLAQINPAAQKVLSTRFFREGKEQAVQALEKLQSEKYRHSPLLQSLGVPMPVDIWLENIHVFSFDDGRGLGPRQSDEVAGRVNYGIREGANTGRANTSREKTAGGVGNVVVTNETPPPPPNYVVISGRAGSVPSIGVYLYGLKQLGLFEHLELAEILEGTEAGYQYWEFSINCFLKPGGRVRC